jgi:hypothetical protein
MRKRTRSSGQRAGCSWEVEPERWAEPRRRAGLEGAAVVIAILFLTFYKLTT